MKKKKNYKKLHTEEKAHQCLGLNDHTCRRFTPWLCQLVSYPNLAIIVTLNTLNWYIQYVILIHSNYMEMRVIFVLNFNRMDKAICQCKYGNLLGMFGNMTIRIMGYTETKMSSFWWKFHHWLHRKLSFWQLSVQPVMKISSKWRHFRFSVRCPRATEILYLGS